MRLFVAVPLPPRVRAGIRRALDEVGTDDDDVRWVPEELWHVTVAFLGEAATDDLPAVQEHWTRLVAALPPLTLRIAGAGAFPHPRRARVLWAGVDVDPEAWARLAGDDETTPHVTLARVRPARDVGPTLEVLATLQTPPWRCRSLALVESRPGTETSQRYTRLATFPAG